VPLDASALVRPNQQEPAMTSKISYLQRNGWPRRCWVERHSELTTGQEIMRGCNPPTNSLFCPDISAKLIGVNSPTSSKSSQGDRKER